MSNQAIPKTHQTFGVMPEGMTKPSAPWRVAHAELLADYAIKVVFFDGVSGVVDCRRLLSSADLGIYAPLKDGAVFNRFSINYGAITWPNGADLDPAWMYDEISKFKQWAVPF